MQHKSVFAQTGRATYITLMTMQSQGGTANETKCNYRPPLIWKQNKPHALTEHWNVKKQQPWKKLLHITAQRHNELPCHCLDQCSCTSLGFPLADGSATTILPGIHELIKNRELQEVLLSLTFYQYLTETFYSISELLIRRKQCTLLSGVSEVCWKPVLSASFSLSCCLCLSPFYILLIQGDLCTSPRLYCAIELEVRKV